MPIDSLSINKYCGLCTTDTHVDNVGTNTTDWFHTAMIPEDDTPKEVINLMDNHKAKLVISDR